MIPLWITIFAFCTAAYFTKSLTYAILAFSSIVNLYIDNFTRADDLYLMLTYSSIEFFTCLAVLFYGDIHKIYQSVILTLMLLLHFTMEYALEYDYIGFIESGVYVYAMSGLIIMQLLGASHGMDRIATKSRPSNNLGKNNHSGLFNH